MSTKNQSVTFRIEGGVRGGAGQPAEGVRRLRPAGSAAGRTRPRARTPRGVGRLLSSRARDPLDWIGPIRKVQARLAADPAAGPRRKIRGGFGPRAETAPWPRFQTQLEGAWRPRPTGSAAGRARRDSKRRAPHGQCRRGSAGPRTARSHAGQGWQGRGVARGAGRQNVATPAGSRVAKKMTGSLFESKNHHSHHNIGLEH